MQMPCIMDAFGIGDGGRNFRGIVKTSICRMKTRARVDASGAT